MTRILIPTYPHDVHAVEVALALRDQGHEAVLWNGPDFPDRQRLSLRFEPDGGFSWNATGTNLDVGERFPSSRVSFDVVWFRRPSFPVLPEAIDPADHDVATREANSFIRGMWSLVGPQAVAVNPQSSRRAALKAIQLREAARIGLRIPPTLMSNDPERIRDFVQQHGGCAVYKPFYPAQWDTDDGAALLFTTEITLQDLEDDEVLQWTPGIFQPRVPKSHELRVTLMGEHAAVAALRFPEDTADRLDWRPERSDLLVEPGRLPDSVLDACHRLMDRLDLRFGCLDFLVTPEGDIVFLEVNPMGQFLWVEEACPELPVLAPFCAFLAQGAPRNFRWGPSPDSARHREWYGRARAWIGEHAKHHVPLPPTLVGPDVSAAKPNSAALSEAVAGGETGSGDSSLQPMEKEYVP